MMIAYALEGYAIDHRDDNGVMQDVLIKFINKNAVQLSRSGQNASLVDRLALGFSLKKLETASYLPAVKLGADLKRCCPHWEEERLYERPLRCVCTGDITQVGKESNSSMPFREASNLITVRPILWDLGSKYMNSW